MVIYKNMLDVLQETSKGVASVTKFKAEGIQAMIQGIPVGEYIRLTVNGTLMMSNTPMEKRTSSNFVMNAQGDVLICGLGIGLVIMPLLENSEVKSITVVEKYQDVIDCVLPQIKPYDTENKLNVICQDCFEFTTKDKFDTIFLDIWPFVNSDIYKEEMLPLKRKYRKFLSEQGKASKNIFVWAENNARYDKPLY